MAHPRMCPHCRAFIDPKAKICDYCGNELGKPLWKQQAASTGGRGLIPQGNFTTLIILLVNFGLFAATLIMTFKQGDSTGLMAGIDGHVLRLFGAKDRFLILHGEWWRLVTAGFLHGGVLHILMNSWVMFDLGFRVEELFGTARFLVIYLVSSACGFVASTFWTPYLSIGASAGIFGLIGAMIADGRRSGDPIMSSMYLRWALIILVIGFLPFFPFDNAAHVGGLAAGFLIAYFGGTPRISDPIESVWKVAAGTALAVVALSFYLAYESLSERMLF